MAERDLPFLPVFRHDEGRTNRIPDDGSILGIAAAHWGHREDPMQSVFR